MGLACSAPVHATSSIQMEPTPSPYGAGGPPVAVPPAMPSCLQATCEAWDTDGRGVTEPGRASESRPKGLAGQLSWTPAFDFEVIRTWFRD